MVVWYTVVFITTTACYILVICVVVLYVLIVVATEEKIHSHWCKTLGKDEASRERAVYLPHFQVGEMVTDLGYQNMQW